MSKSQIEVSASIWELTPGSITVSEQDVYASLKRSKWAQMADVRNRGVIPENREIIYVGMNSSNTRLMYSGENSLLATGALAGCTGVAGFAGLEDGRVLTFLSHYDIGADAPYEGEILDPISDMLQRFKNKVDGVTGRIDSSITLFIAYDRDDNQRLELLYGKKSGGYIDRIYDTTLHFKGARTLFLPYSSDDHAHTLAIGRTASQDGIFWDGTKIDFDKYIPAK